MSLHHTAPSLLSRLQVENWLSQIRLASLRTSNKVRKKRGFWIFGLADFHNTPSPSSFLLSGLLQTRETWQLFERDQSKGSVWRNHPEACERHYSRMVHNTLQSVVTQIALLYHLWFSITCQSKPSKSSKPSEPSEFIAKLHNSLNTFKCDDDGRSSRREPHIDHGVRGRRMRYVTLPDLSALWECNGALMCGFGTDRKIINYTSSSAKPMDTWVSSKYGCFCIQRIVHRY